MYPSGIILFQNAHASKAYPLGNHLNLHGGLLQGVIDTLKFDEHGRVIIGNICIGTGIGDYAHYIARPTSENDLHGAGAFILMCAEMNQALV